MSTATYLSTLEDTLKNIRGMDLNPETKIWWNMLTETYLKLAIDNTREGDVILDVGCGVGNYIIPLSKNNRICYGIDPFYEVSLLKAQQKAKDENVINLPILLAVGENLPFKDKKFNVVLLQSTLQHVNDQDKTLSEIKRVLKDNGFLLVSVPTNGNISTLFIKTKKPECFTKDFDLKEVKKVITKNGFEILEIRGSGFFLPLAHKALFVCYRLFGEKITRKMIELLDIFARSMPQTASSVVAICRKIEGEVIR